MMPDVDLQNTYWKLVVLGNEPVAVEPTRREPHLVLNLAEQKMRGHGGCNHFVGTYDFDGDRLQLRPIAASRIDCAGSMEQEQRFLQVLHATERFGISGEELELFGPEGSLAHFRAVFLQ